MKHFRDEPYKPPGKAEKPVRLLTSKDLYEAYKSILSDLDSCGAYEPVAQGVKDEWD